VPAAARHSRYSQSVLPTLSVDEFALLNFFGAIPVQSEDDVPWIYNDSLYEVTTGQTHVAFAVAPAYHDVRIRLQVSGALLYELNAMGIEDVRVHNDKGREWLEVVVSQRQSIRRGIAPEISLTERLDDPAGGISIA
jgi:hypothetical protein